MTRRLVVMTTLLLLMLAIASAAMAADLQKNMIFTVNEPVALPGRMLDPGTYDLRFIDPEHSIAAVTRADGSAIGEYRVTRIARAETDDQAGVVVDKLPDGSAALMEWFYPGESYAYQLTYDQKPGLLALQNAHSIGKSH